MTWRLITETEPQAEITCVLAWKDTSNGVVGWRSMSGLWYLPAHAQYINRPPFWYIEIPELPNE